MNQISLPRVGKFFLLLLVVLSQASLVFAQDGEASSSPAGLSMLILFLGIAGIIGVLVIRWSQAASEDED